MKELINKKAEELFSVHHCPGRYKVNLTWDGVTESIRDWYIVLARHVLTEEIKTEIKGIESCGYFSKPDHPSNAKIRYLTAQLKELEDVSSL